MIGVNSNARHQLILSEQSKRMLSAYKIWWPSCQYQNPLYGRIYLSWKSRAPGAKCVAVPSGSIIWITWIWLYKEKLGRSFGSDKALIAETAAAQVSAGQGHLPECRHHHLPYDTAFGWAGCDGGYRRLQSSRLAVWLWRVRHLVRQVKPKTRAVIGAQARVN